MSKFKIILAALLLMLGLGGIGASVASASNSNPNPTNAAIVFPATGSVAITNAPSDTEKVKWYDDSDGSATYLGAATTSPWTFSISPAVTVIQARIVVDKEIRLESNVPTSGPTTPPTSPSDSPTASPSPTDSPTPTPTPTPTVTPTEPTTPPASDGSTINVSTQPQLVSALANAQPGDTIVVAPGTYDQTKGNLEAPASGTATEPITLTGPGAVLESDGISGKYGLHLTGSYWYVHNIAVANSSKGIVLDGSQHTILDDVEVYNIGDEGVHFRDCSSNDVLENSYVHDTGKKSQSYGEGVYVGSAKSNWSSYSCTDGHDNSENNLITHNVLQNDSAEGADLKEGTDSGTLSYNVFDNDGFSGQNSADSAVDVKGNNWQIIGNTTENPSGSFNDGFQVHNVTPGYGFNNVFHNNTVEGTIPGFGFGLYPANGSVVYCDNTATGAAQGLVGISSKSASCTP